MLYLIHRTKQTEAAKTRRQRNMCQMKTQEKALEKELNKMEISNLLDMEFKTLAIRMLSELTGRIDQLNENFNKETGNIKM